MKTSIKYLSLITLLAGQSFAGFNYEDHSFEGTETVNHVDGTDTIKNPGVWSNREFEYITGDSKTICNKLGYKSFLEGSLVTTSGIRSKVLHVDQDGIEIREGEVFKPISSITCYDDTPETYGISDERYGGENKVKIDRPFILRGGRSIYLTAESPRGICDLFGYGRPAQGSIEYYDNTNKKAAALNSKGEFKGLRTNTKTVKSIICNKKENWFSF